MKTLHGDAIYLRALELTDIEFLYLLENDEQIWEVSHTTKPYSKYVLKQYLDNAHRDIYEVKQLRLVICNVANNRPLGFVDLFDFDPKHQRVGVGIIIFATADRGKGFAEEGLQLIQNYAATHLKVHQLYANITEDNTASIALFEKLKYELVGIKKDWILAANGFKNELLYQLLIRK